MFNFLSKNIRLLGLIFMIIGIAAWAMELSNLVYVCPYCRVQRTVIALLGVIMLLKYWRHEITFFFANILAFFGAVVAVNQNLQSLGNISNGNFDVIFMPVYKNPFLLSFSALIIISLQISLINIVFYNKKSIINRM